MTKTRRTVAGRMEMPLWKYLVVLVLVVTQLFDNAAALWCYQCHSAMAGCGDALDIRLIRWRKCDNSMYKENFCVKVVEKIGSTTYITRGCMDALLASSMVRLDMPTVRRHGYCPPGRIYERMMINDALSVGDDSKMYCFCNDWNGCNAATPSTSISTFALLGAALFAFLFGRAH